MNGGEIIDKYAVMTFSNKDPFYWRTNKYNTLLLNGITEDLVFALISPEGNLICESSPIKIFILVNQYFLGLENQDYQ